MTRNHQDAQFTALRVAFSAGQMSRREFLNRAAALGLVAAALTAAGGSAEAAVAKKGGVLRVGSAHGQTTDTLDPALLFTPGQWLLAYAIRNTLTQVGAGTGLEPCLATEWEPSADATSWAFTLRSGVEFHHGKTLTIEDVIASINHHRGADSESAVKPIADQIKDLRADGASILVFDLVKPNVDFPYSLASANFTICKAVDGGIDANSGIGTGGYVLKDYEPGVRANLERNPNYWRDDRAHADTVELLTIADSAARINALVSGSVDVIDDLEFKVVAKLADSEGITVERTQGPLHYLFSMMSNTPPFDNKDVRLAMKYAVDREELLAKILSGYGVLGNDHPIGPSYPYHDPDLEQRLHDPDKAKFHLKQAGLSSLEVNLSAGDAAFGGAVDAAVLFQEVAKKSGIDITVVREPNDGYWDDVYMNRPIFTNFWGGYTTASEMFSTGYVPGAAWNDSVFENERFAELLDLANAELDAGRRREMMSEMQRIVRDEAGQLIFAFPNNLSARNDKVAHGELAADRPLDGLHLIERWWVV